MSTTHTITAKGDTIAFESPYDTTEEAVERLRTALENGETKSDFARDLVTARHLSPKQESWVHRLATDIDLPAPTNEIVGEDGLGAVVAMLDKAHDAMKWPKVRLQLEDGEDVVLSRAGDKAKKPGSVNVTDGRPYGSNTWYGRINRDGTWSGGRGGVSMAVRELLEALADDPEGTVAEYGKATGNCSFCNRPLEDERSLEFGYGPVCAKHYGLHWS